MPRNDGGALEYRSVCWEIPIKPEARMHFPRSLATSLLATLLLAASATAVSAQRAIPGPQRFAVMAGLGNAFGGVGFAAEYHVANGLVGVSTGLGVMPPHDVFDRAFGAAAAVRVYSGRGRHALFGQAGVMPVLQQWTVAEQRVLYGPALSVGYRYLAAGGFTAMIDIGAGWSSQDAALVSSLGFGYRWR